MESTNESKSNCSNNENVLQSSVESSICYELRTLSRPCIHEVIRCLLEKNQQFDAMEVIQYTYRNHYDFIKLGELLVRESLEKLYEDKKSFATTKTISTTITTTTTTIASSSSVLLQRVVLLLQRFSGYEDIIMRVGRRAERNRWHLLFPLCGSPKQLFDTALNKKKFHVASSFLVIMDNFGEIDSRVSSSTSNAYHQGPSKISKRRAMKQSYDNTTLVLNAGEKLIRMIEKEVRNDYLQLINNIQSYLDRLKLKKAEVLSILRNMD